MTTKFKNKQKTVFVYFDTKLRTSCKYDKREQKQLGGAVSNQQQHCLFDIRAILC